MNSISALLIDDDPYTREQFQDLLKKSFPEVTLKAVCSNGQEGLDAIQLHNPDLIFLDIEMPGLNGFEMLVRLPSINFEIIFITSYNQYAIRAIRFSALDYLLKPIQTHELREAINRFKNKNRLSDTGARLTNYLYNARNPQSNEFRLAISTTEGTHFLSLDDISFCEAQINYTLFHLEGKNKILSSKTLKEYDELLSDHHFIRVHKSYLVNRKQVRSLTGNHKLLMNNGSMVDVSKRKFSEVKSLLSH